MKKPHWQKRSKLFIIHPPKPLPVDRYVPTLNMDDFHAWLLIGVKQNYVRTELDVKAWIERNGSTNAARQEATLQSLAELVRRIVNRYKTEEGVTPQ